MARPLRIQYPGAWYHIMNRGGQKRDIFLNENDRREFLKLLAEAISMWRIEIHAYSLLNNHYHLLIHTPEGNISRSMRHIDGVYTQRFNLRHNCDGHLFRGRYKSILIDKGNYLLEVLRYIHLQSVRANIVKQPEEDPWTSHWAYLHKKGGFPWLSTTYFLSMFNRNNTHTSRRLLDKFVKDRIPEEIEDFYSKERKPPILGSEEFIKNIRDKFLKDSKSFYEIPDSKFKKDRKLIQSINQIICNFYDIPLQEVTKTTRGKRNEARKIAVFLSRNIGGFSLKEIADFYNFSNYSGVGSILYRINRKLDKDKNLAGKIAILKKRILDTVK